MLRVQYSLTWFIALFVQAIKDSSPAPELAARLKNLDDYFTYFLYKMVCRYAPSDGFACLAKYFPCLLFVHLVCSHVSDRSLFEKDKLLFSFLLASRLMKASGQLDEAEFRFLITGGTSIGSIPTNECPWLSDKSWAELVRLDQLPSMTGFLEGFPQESRWHQLFESTEPFKFPFPGQWEHCSGFQRLLIMRCIRPDKIVPAVMLFVSEQMGQNFIEPPPFDLAACFEDSNPCSPLIFVLSAGADPNASLFKLAEEKG